MAYEPGKEERGITSVEDCVEYAPKSKRKRLVGWFIGFYGISTFVGYLTPNPFYVNNLFFLKQFSLA